MKNPNTLGQILVLLFVFVLGVVIGRLVLA